MLGLVAEYHREEIFIADLYNAGHVFVLLSESVGDGLEQDAGLNEVVKGQTLLGLRVVAGDHQLSKLRRQSVAQLCKRCTIYQAADNYHKTSN